MIDFLDFEKMEEGKYYSSDCYLELGNFFSVIKHYMNSIYIFSDEDMNEVYYFKYKNLCFKIEQAYAPDLMYFIKKINSEKIELLIDIEDIKNGIVPDERKAIVNKINAINNAISEIKKNGVSCMTLKKSIKF